MVFWMEITKVNVAICILPRMICATIQGMSLFEIVFTVIYEKCHDSKLAKKRKEIRFVSFVWSVIWEKCT